MIVSIFCVSPVWVIAITKRNVCLVYRHKKLVTVNIHSYIEWGIVCVDHLCCLSAFSEAKDDFPFYLPDMDWEALTFSMICKTKLCPLTTLVLSSQNENAFFFFFFFRDCFAFIFIWGWFPCVVLVKQKMPFLSVLVAAFASGLFKIMRICFYDRYRHTTPVILALSKEINFFL